MIHTHQVCLSHRVAWCVLGMPTHSDGQCLGLGVGRGEMTGRSRSVGGVRHDVSCRSSARPVCSLRS